MATECVWSLRDGTGDYSDFATWESDVACDLTAATTKVFSYTGTPTSVLSGQAVEGDTSTATGTVQGVIADSGRLLITGISGTFQSGETLSLDANSADITLADAGDSAIAVIEGYDDWPSGLTFATITPGGWTTDANNYVHFRAADGHEVDGFEVDSGFYCTSGGATIVLAGSDSTPFWRVSGMGWKRERTTSSSYSHFRYAREGQVFDRLVCEEASGGSQGEGWLLAAQQTTEAQLAVMRNSLIRYAGTASSTTARAFYTVSTVSTRIENVTVVNHGYGIYVNGSKDSYARNCVAYNCTTGFQGNSYLYGNYNASDDGTANSAGSLTDGVTGLVDADFIDVTNHNFQPALGSALARAGTDLSADFDKDVQGHTRTARTTSDWDIGAYNAIREEKWALRSASGWSGMTAGEQAAYNGQYSDPVTWDAAVATDIVALDEIAVLEGFDDWTGDGLPYSTHFYLQTDWVVDEHRHIRFCAADGEQHSGRFGEGFRLNCANRYGVRAFIDHTHLRGLVFSATSPYPPVSSGGYALIEECLGKRTGSGEGIFRCGEYSVTRNCIALGGTSVNYDRGFSAAHNQYVRFENCTAINNADYGFYSSPYPNAVAINCVAYNCGDSFYNTYFDAALSTNNAASDASTTTPPGVSPVTTDIVAGDFVDAANDNYQPASGSTLARAGTDLSADFSDDIQGHTRTARTTTDWDVGAFNALREEVASMGDGTRDYSSFATWEANEPRTLDLVDEIAVIEVYNDTAAGIEVTNADVLNLDADWSYDDQHRHIDWGNQAGAEVPLDNVPHISIRPAAGSGNNGTNRHDGTFGTGAKVTLNATTASNRDFINFDAAIAVRLDGLELVSKRTAGGDSYGNYMLGYVDASWVNNRLDASNILIKNENTDGRCYGAFVAYGGGSAQRAVNLWNCLLDSTGATAKIGNFFRQDTSCYGRIANCTVIGLTANMLDNAGGVNIEVNNVVAVGGSSYDWSSGWGPVTHNASEDATAPGTSPQLNVVPSTVFADYAGGDYAPVSGQALAGNGTDLSSWFTTDITGATRSTWDIGAFIAVVGGDTALTLLAATHGHAADALTLTQSHVLSLAAGTHAHSADTFALTQQHVLAIAEALHTQTADGLTVVQGHVLALAETLHAHTADGSVLTQQHVLALAESVHAHVADSLSLAQVHALLVAAATHGQAVDSITISQGQALAVIDALHAHTADGSVLTQQHVLALAESVHAHVADSLSLAQVHALLVAAATHGQTADVLTLSGAANLAILPATHGHIVDALTLTQQHLLTLSQTLHSHTADSFGLAQAHVLAVSESLHGQTAATITTTSELALALQAATHGHLADNGVLTQQHLLTVAPATHTSEAAVVSLVQAHSLSLAASTHAHAADTIQTFSDTALALAEAVHTSTAGAVTVSQEHILAVLEALHGVSSDAVSLTQQHTLIVNDALHDALSTTLRLSLVADTLPPTRHAIVLKAENRAILVLREDWTTYH